MQNSPVVHRGSCHCGAVAFEVEAPERFTALRCNCSICAKAGFLHLIVPKSRFRLLRGEENLTTYTFNTGVAKHTFCRTCGIEVEAFDGRDWEANAAGLAALSRE